MAALQPSEIISASPSAFKVAGSSTTKPVQGTIVSAKEVSGNRLSLQIVSTTPDDYATGNTITIDGEDVVIQSVSKPTIKTKSGKTLIQKSSNITMPANGSVKFNKIQIVMEF